MDNRQGVNSLSIVGRLSTPQSVHSCVFFSLLSPQHGQVSEKEHGSLHPRCLNKAHLDNP